MTAVQIGLTMQILNLLGMSAGIDKHCRCRLQTVQYLL